MTTYRAWVKDQENRDDSVGWYARYWSVVTPGKISTPTGILRHLEQMLNEYVTENREEEAKITKQAIELHAEVLAEYHRKSALEQAIATGAIPAPKTDMTQLPLNEPVPGGPPSGTERPVTDPEKVLEAQEHAGWLPLDRFEAMERDLAVVKRAVLAVLGTVTAGDVLARVTGEPPEVTVLVSEPTGWDWDAMYEAGISG